MRLAPFLLPLTLLACGGTTNGGSPGGTLSDPTGTGNLSGAVGGTTFTVASVVGGLESASTVATCATSEDGGETCNTTSTGQVAGILITNRADATCSFVRSQATSATGLNFGSYDVLQLSVTNSAGNITVGTYSLQNDTGIAISTSASATFSTTDATCDEVTGNFATEGSITLTEVTPYELAGTYDVTFGETGSFTGSFTVGVCYLADAGVAPSDGGGPVCRP